jgi:catechol 2,3-dioxygenase-like lactoylglutathione lyase family enzyme
MRIVEICLITKNVPNLAEFYKEVLGVTADGDDTHVILGTEGLSMCIFSVEGMENLAPQSMRGAGVGNFTIGFEVKDVDREYERLSALDVEFVKKPTTHPWGARSFWFRDPDGNIVNFFTVLKK